MTPKELDEGQAAAMQQGREAREVELEEFALARAREETEKGRKFTLVVMEFDHSDGRFSNVVYGDLQVATKLCKHLANDLAMKVIQKVAKDMGIPIDNHTKAQ